MRGTIPFKRYRKCPDLRLSAAFTLFLLAAVVLSACGTAGDPLPDDIYSQNMYPGAGSTFAIGSDTTTYSEGYFDSLYGTDGYFDAIYIEGELFVSLSNLFDSKGDLIVATADNTPVRFGVGTNDLVLTANNTYATGITWAAPPATAAGPHTIGGGSHIADTFANLKAKVNDAVLASITDITNAISAHNALVSGVHGVNASTVESILGSQTKVNTHAALTASTHGVSASGFEDKDEKSAANGYASLDAGTKVPTAELGGAGADNTKYLRGDQSWQVIAGGLAYTELDGSDTTTANAEGAGDGAWVDWDISAIVPGGCTTVEVVIQKLGATDDVGVRENGVALVREFNVPKFGHLTLTVTCDANRIIEIMSNDVSDLDVFSIVGYWN